MLRLAPWAPAVQVEAWRNEPIQPRATLLSPDPVVRPTSDFLPFLPTQRPPSSPPAADPVKCFSPSVSHPGTPDMTPSSVPTSSAPVPPPSPKAPPPQVQKNTTVSPEALPEAVSDTVKHSRWLEIRESVRVQRELTEDTLRDQDRVLQNLCQKVDEWDKDMKDRDSRWQDVRTTPSPSSPPPPHPSTKVEDPRWDEVRRDLRRLQEELALKVDIFRPDLRAQVFRELPPDPKDAETVEPHNTPRLAWWLWWLWVIGGVYLAYWV